MTSLGRLISAEWIKLRGTSTKWIFLLTPLFCASVFLFYFGATHNRNPADHYQFYMVAICFALPVLISIICGVVSMQEEKAGQFQILLGGTSRATSYTSKLTSLLLFTLASIISAVAIFLIGAKYLIGVEGGGYVSYLQACVALIFGCIILYIIHLLIAFVSGIGASVTLGGAGLLLTGLMETGLGDTIWKYIPWAWNIRLIEGILVLNSTVYPYEYRALIEQESYKAIPYMIIYTVVALIGSLWWFSKWEGRTSSD